MKRTFRRNTLVYAVISHVLSTQVLAQTPDAGKEQDDSLIEHTIVTASRLHRVDNTTSPVPLQVMSMTDIEEAGLFDLADVLAEIPGVADGIASRSSNNNVQSAGLSTVQLRRLGDDRTLVLINGKRSVSNSGNADRVSLNTLPEGLVERAEVTTGGASAIYGSDAIAGVVNLILEKDFEGFSINSRYSTPEASGGEEVDIGFKWGGELAEGKAYVIVAGDARERNMIRADNSRPLSTLALEFDNPTTSSQNTFANEECDPENPGKHCLLSSLSGYTPGGVFEGGDAWFSNGQWFNDQSLQPSDRSGTQDFYGDYDGHNLRPGLSLMGERKIYNLGVLTNVEINDGLTFSGMLTHNKLETLTAGGFQIIDDDDEFAYNPAFGEEGESLFLDEVGDIASSNPFVPEAVEETRVGAVAFDRRLIEVGEQQRINHRETTRLALDLIGDMGESQWQAYFSFGAFSQKQTNPNEVNLLKMQRALTARENDNGEVECYDPDTELARSDGCVPLNLFGEGSITPVAANYIRYDGYAEQDRDQLTFGAFINHPLFNLPAGELLSVVGFEYRKESQDTRGDPDGDLVGGIDGDPSTNDADITTLTTFPSISAEYEVLEFFTELGVPITDTLQVELAARVSEYSTIGDIASWNLGAHWQSTDFLRFRTQYSRAQRAPNITEFFSPRRPDTDSVSDPCEGLLVDGSFEEGSEPEAFQSQISENCLKEQGIQAYFQDEENAGEPFDSNSVINGPNAGNNNLKEETADTFTFGFVLNPADNFSLIVDYFKIEIDDAITSLESDALLDRCYASADFPNNKFCNVITRNSASGRISEIVNYQENLEKEEVEGVDVSVKWNFRLPFVSGRWDTGLRYSQYLKDELQFEGLGGVVETESRLGEVNNAEREAQFNLGYKLGGFRLRYTLNFEEGGVADAVLAGDPTDDEYYAVDDQLYHRIYAAYSFGEQARYQLFAGINNIEDDHGPLLPSGLRGENSSSSNILEDINDVTGREFYLGFRYTLD